MSHIVRSLATAGSCAVLPAALALAALSPAAAAQTLSWTFGPGAVTASDQAGRSIAVLRDGAGVGHTAVIVGAPHDTNGMTTGEVWVLDGVDPTHVLHSSLGAPTEELGYAVTSVPDLNGDGRDDYAASLPGATFQFFQSGGYRVFSGKTGAIIDVVAGTQDFQRLGGTLAGIGDVDGDGAGDILAGAPEMNGPGGALDPDRGYAALYSGKTGVLIDEWFGAHDNDRLGAALAGLGDLDYDGREDFAIGVPGLDVGSPFSIIDAGSCDVYSGKTRSLLVSVTGGGGFEELGSAISALGDRDNDGAFEFAVGGPGWSAGKGRVRVCEGLQATLQATITGLSSSQVADRFGAALAPGGDVNHDGHDDLLVTASREGTGLAGYAQVISGADWSVFGNTLFGPIGSGFGSNVAGGLDADGDGWTDAFFGLPDWDSVASNAGGARGYRFTTQQENLGAQGPGPTTLEVYGTPLYSGGHADLRVEGLQPFSPAYLVASLVALNAPFKGGVLVPHPGVGLVLPLTSNVFGELSLLDLPGGGGSFDLLVQVLGKSNTAPKGWWISNAVKMKFLP